MLPLTIWETSFLVEELGEGLLVNINRKVQQNDNNVPEEVVLAKNKQTKKHFTLKKLSQTFLDMESTEDKTLEADSN